MTRGIDVKMPAVVLDETLLGLAERGRDAIAVLGAGMQGIGGGPRLLAPGPSQFPRDVPRAMSRLIQQGRLPLLVGLRSALPAEDDAPRWRQMLIASGAPLGAALWFQESSAELKPFGIALHDGDAQDIDRLLLPGPGMAKLTVGSMWPRRSVEGVDPVAEERSDRSEDVDLDQVPEHLSRIAAAIGNGDALAGMRILQVFGELDIVLIGCGRSGETMAWRLAKNGAGSYGRFVLVDGDTFELGNIGVLLPASAVGLHKAVAVAKLATALGAGPSTLPLVGTVSDQSVVDAIASSDVAITCVDDDAARTGVAAICQRHLVVHLDVTGGVIRGPSGEAIAGGEARLSLPGHRGCLCCLSEMPADEAVSRLSESEDEERERRRKTVWHEQRVGSWPEVLMVTAGQALQELFRLLQGRRRHASWFRYSHDVNECPTWSNWSGRIADRASRCPVCSAGGIAGLGDQAP